MSSGDLESAVRVLNQTTGEPRRILAQWIHQARLSLEVKQANGVKFHHKRENFTKTNSKKFQRNSQKNSEKNTQKKFTKENSNKFRRNSHKFQRNSHKFQRNSHKYHKQI